MFFLFLSIRKMVNPSWPDLECRLHTQKDCCLERSNRVGRSSRTFQPEKLLQGMLKGLDDGRPIRSGRSRQSCLTAPEKKRTNCLYHSRDPLCLQCSSSKKDEPDSLGPRFLTLSIGCYGTFHRHHHCHQRIFLQKILADTHA